MALHLCGSFHLYLECHWLNVLSSIFISPLVLNVLSHLEPSNILSHLWVLSCLLNCSLFCLGPFIFFQVPVQVLLCVFKLAVLLNTMLHFEQGKSFSPMWILSCFLELMFLSNMLLHLEQAFGFLPVWILSCLLRVSLTKCTLHIWNRQKAYMSFHVHSCHHLFEMSCHIWSRQMVSPLWGSFHDS